MFALPLITPTHTIQLSPSHQPYTYQPEAAPTDPTLAAAAQAQRRQNPPTNPFSPLSVLKADEDAIRQRKSNIARFGSTWIKPPGVSKTLQAETEERAEREEQELLARREQMMLDMQAQQEREEARARMEEEASAEDDEGRDLDDEVPDAEEESLEDDEEDSSEEEDDDEEEGMEDDLDAEVPEASGLGMERDLDMSIAEGVGSTEGDMTFTDGSLLEGSMFVDNRGGDEENGEVAREIAEQERYARMEEAELTGAAQEEYELGMEGNLDDSVPEAGAYEHTDTELEDDSSEEEEEASFAMPARPEPQRRTSGRTGLFDISRRALGGRQSGGSAGSRSSLSARDASSLLDSSFVTSSPVVGRLRSGNNRGRSR